MRDLRRDALHPRTFGEWIDALIVQNLRMWHEQELVYETEALARLSEEELRGYLRRATWINLERNAAIDGLDAQLVGQLFPGGTPVGGPEGAPRQVQVWERP